MSKYRQALFVLGLMLTVGQAVAEMPDREKLEAALEACAASLNASGDSKPDSSAMDSCMSEKGFTRPSGHPRHGGAGGGRGNPPPEM